MADRHIARGQRRAGQLAQLLSQTESSANADLRKTEALIGQREPPRPQGGPAIPVRLELAEGAGFAGAP